MSFRIPSTTPLIISFTPQAGKIGDIITINGESLNETTNVKFGGVAAKSFNIISKSEIKAVLGSGASGAVSIENPFGNFSLPGFTFIPSSGISDLINLKVLSIYPNPAKDELIISTNQKLNGSHIIITDMLGRKILEENITNVSNEHTVLVSGLKTGAYILSIQKEGEISRVKFVKE